MRKDKRSNEHTRFKASMILLFGEADLFGDLTRLAEAEKQVVRGFEYDETDRGWAE